MFREMRRKDKKIDMESIEEILINERYGVLAMNGEDGYPYAIPINFYYDKENQKIIYHGSKVGYKNDVLENSDKVCFTVTGDEVIKEESWAPFVKSVIIFGKTHIIEDEDRAMKALKDFSMKYYPTEEIFHTQLEKNKSRVRLFEIDIDHIAGKEVKEK